MHFSHLLSMNDFECSKVRIYYRLGVRFDLGEGSERVKDIVTLSQGASIFT